MSKSKDIAVALAERLRKCNPEIKGDIFHATTPAWGQLFGDAAEFMQARKASSGSALAAAYDEAFDKWLAVLRHKDVIACLEQFKEKGVSKTDLAYLSETAIVITFLLSAEKTKAKVYAPVSWWSHSRHKAVKQVIAEECQDSIEKLGSGSYALNKETGELVPKSERAPFTEEMDKAMFRSLLFQAIWGKQ